MEQYLVHHGIKGQKWGIRRYQNEDGTLTAAGRERYGYGPDGGRTEGGKIAERNAYRKALNKTELARSHNRAEEIKYEEKVQKSRSARAYEKNKAKLDNYHELVESGKKEVESLLSEAAAKGYTFDTKLTMEYQRKGKLAVTQFLAGLIGAVPVGGYDLAKHYTQRDRYEGESQAFTYRTKYKR